jgi:hypothetical protein
MLQSVNNRKERDRETVRKNAERIMDIKGTANFSIQVLIGLGSRKTYVE